MRRLRFLFLFLLALIADILICGSCVVVAGYFGAAMYMASNEPPIPESLNISTTASVPVTNPQLRVSFKLPEDLTLIGSGTNRTLHYRYAAYGLKGRPLAPTFRITQEDVGVSIPPEEIVSTETSSRRWLGENVVPVYETIDGVPAGGIRFADSYRARYHLRVSQLGLTLIFDWTSHGAYKHELEQIYRSMLPTIKIERPPP